MSHDEGSRLRMEELHNRAAMRDAEDTMAAEAQELERELRTFEGHLDQAEQMIDAELRTEHWGHEPGQLADWRSRSDRPASPGRAGARRRAARCGPALLGAPGCTKPA
jgi:hypothetical protein